MTGSPRGHEGAGGDAAGDRRRDTEPSPAELDEDARGLAGAIALLFAGAMHLVIGVFVALSGRLAPAWAVAALAIGWGVLAVLIVRWHRQRPIATLLVPFAGAGLLWIAVELGDRLLGWGA